jgi:hypothetical protein
VFVLFRSLLLVVLAICTARCELRAAVSFARNPVLGVIVAHGCQLGFSTGADADQPDCLT